MEVIYYCSFHIGQWNSIYLSFSVEPVIETVPGELLVVREGESAALSCEVNKKRQREWQRRRKRDKERDSERGRDTYIETDRQPDR